VKIFDGTLLPHELSGIMRMMDTINDLVADFLERGTREGIFVAVDSHKLARVMKNVLKGFSLEALERKDMNMDKDLELIKMVLSYGIIVGGGEK
jgi:hypothetical protein